MSEHIFPLNSFLNESRGAKHKNKCRTFCEANYRKQTLEELHSARRWSINKLETRREKQQQNASRSNVGCDCIWLKINKALEKIARQQPLYELASDRSDKRSLQIGFLLLWSASLADIRAKKSPVLQATAAWKLLIFWHYNPPTCETTEWKFVRVNWWRRQTPGLWRQQQNYQIAFLLFIELSILGM